MGEDYEVKIVVRKICDSVLALLLIFFLYKMVVGITTGTEQIYETERSMFLWNGVMYCTLAIFLCARINLRNIWLWLFFVFYTAIEYFLLSKTGYRVNSPTLWAWFTQLWNAVGIAGIILLNAIFERRIRNFAKVDWPIMFLLWISCGGILALKGFQINDVVLLGIILSISIIQFDTCEVKRFIYALVVAYYIAFIKIYMESLIYVPYEGEERYYGTFTNNGLFGSFAGGATICCIAFCYLSSKVHGKMFKVGMVVSIIAAIPTIIAVNMISARVAMLGILLALVTVLLLLALEKGRIRLAVGVIVITVAFLVIGFGVLFLMHKFVSRTDLEILKMDHKQIGSSLLFWYDRVERLYALSSFSGIIPAGSILNGIDLFSGWRISYFLEYIKRLNVSGHPFLTLYVEYNGESIELSHPHNTFLTFGYYYGFAFGGLMSITMVVAYIKCIILHMRSDSDLHRNIYTVLFLWMTYCLGIYLNEDYLFNYLPTFIFLLMQSMVLSEKKRMGIEGKDDIEQLC